MPAKRASLRRASSHGGGNRSALRRGDENRSHRDPLQEWQRRLARCRALGCRIGSHHGAHDLGPIPDTEPEPDHSPGAGPVLEGPRAEVSGAAPRPPELASWTFTDNAGGASLRFPLVIFMLVKKASDLLFQLRGLARLTYGNGAFEKLPLGRRRQIIPLQKRRRPQALQDTPLSFRERQWLGAARFGCWPRSTSFALPSGKGAG
jgi:hypothetical protein